MRGGLLPRPTDALFICWYVPALAAAAEAGAEGAACGTVGTAAGAETRRSGGGLAARLAAALLVVEEAPQMEEAWAWEVVESFPPAWVLPRALLGW